MKETMKGAAYRVVHCGAHGAARRTALGTALGAALGTALVAAFGTLALLPPTAGAQEAPPPPAAGPPLRTSWTSDRIPLQVGDVVTILIDELTQASADRDEYTTRNRDRDVSLLGGSATAPSGMGLRTRNDLRDGQSGESSRRNRFTAELSTRVVEVGPGGILRIEGTKKMKLDDHEEEVTIRGWIRPHDVTAGHTVDSWRVADAEIMYTSNGSLVKTGGIWSKILDLIIP
jgi:flagellar L-ring protein precursor FlgH